VLSLCPSKNLLLKNKGYPLFKNNNYTLSEIKTNILSGITVALAMVPEAIAFALIAHVSPLTGLYAAIIVCLITAFFGGRPGMISGATGALAVVMVALVVEHGCGIPFCNGSTNGNFASYFCTT